MPSIKRFLIFFGLFLGLYLGLIILAQSTGMNNAYRNFFCSYGEIAYKALGKNSIEVKLLSEPYEGKKELDVTAVFQNPELIKKAKDEARAQGLTTVDIREARWGLNTWLYALMPVLFLISLFIISPIPWKRKLVGLLSSLILIHLYFGFRLVIELNERVHDHPFLLAGDAGKVRETVWLFMHNILNLEFNYLIVILLWMLFAFPNWDFRGFIEKTQKKG